MISELWKGRMVQKSRSSRGLRALGGGELTRHSRAWLRAEAVGGRWGCVGIDVNLSGLAEPLDLLPFVWCPGCR